jgi:hypothetical protein
MSDVGCWMADGGCWIADVGLRIGDSGGYGLICTKGHLVSFPNVSPFYHQQWSLVQLFEAKLYLCFNSIGFYKISASFLGGSNNLETAYERNKALIGARFAESAFGL